jgi:hypothetical protein
VQSTKNKIAAYFIVRLPFISVFALFGESRVEYFREDRVLIAGQGIAMRVSRLSVQGSEDHGYGGMPSVRCPVYAKAPPWQASVELSE